MSERDSGCDRRPIGQACAASACMLLLLAALSAALRADEQPPKSLKKSQKMLGLVTAVEPQRITILGSDGHDLTVIPREDFTMKVGLGSQVTVWYTPREGVNYLDWMVYPLENFFVPVDQVRSGIKKVILLPNTSLPDCDPLFDGVTNYVETNLGWYVAPRMLAEEIRKRSKIFYYTLQAVDPETGEFDMARYLKEYDKLIKYLASETRVDAVLEVDVEKVMAGFVASVATWDGVSQVMATKLTQSMTSFLPAMAHSHGEVPAATVVAKLWDPKGKLLWSNRRGFAVLSLRDGINHFRDWPLTEVYKDEASVQNWLAGFLGTLAPAKNPTGGLEAVTKGKPQKNNR